MEKTKQRFSYPLVGIWNNVEKAGVKVTCLGLHRDEDLLSCLSKRGSIKMFVVQE